MKSCKDCADRHPGCHGHCERYLKEKAEHDDLAAKRRASLEYSRYMYRMHNISQKIKQTKKRK